MPGGGGVPLGVEDLLIWAFNYVLSMGEQVAQWRNWGVLFETDSGAEPNIHEMSCLLPSVVQQETGCNVWLPVGYSDKVWHPGGDCPPELVGQQYYDAAGHLCTAQSGDPLPAGNYWIYRNVLGFTACGDAIVHPELLDYAGQELLPGLPRGPDMDAFAAAYMAGFQCGTAQPPPSPTPGAPPGPAPGAGAGGLEGAGGIGIAAILGLFWLILKGG